MFQAVKQYIQTMPEIFFWGLWLLGLSGLCILLVQWFKKIKRARLIEDVPTSSIRSAAQGYCEIVGNAAFIKGDSIVSPLTGRECVWYRYRIDEKAGPKRNDWKTVEKATSEHIFVLEDESGQCLIDPLKAEVITYEKASWTGSSRKSQRPTNQSLVYRKGDFQFTEEWIEAEEVLYVIGQFETEGTGEELPDVRTEVRRLLREWKEDPKQHLKAFDTNNDGKIDQDEWQQVQRAAHKQVLRERASSSYLPTVHLMRKPTHSQLPFIISSLNLDELVTHYRRASLVSLGASLGLGLLLLWSLALRF